MEKRMRGFMALVFLLLFAPQAFAASSWQESLSAGRTYFEAGLWQKAHTALEQAFLLEPGNPEISFLLGRTAYENGDFENSVMAFDRVLILDPSSTNRVKLELARSYMGLRAWSPARQYFQEVLAASPPPAVKKNIRAMLAAIDKAEKRHFLSGTLSLEFSMDDNIYISPANDAIRTILGDVILTGTSAHPVSDQVLTPSLTIQHAYKGSSGTVWKSSGTVLNSNYKSEDALDINYLSISTGPSGQRGGLAWELQGLGSILELNNKSYLSRGGLSTFLGFDISSWLRLDFFAKAELKDYRTVSGRDAVSVQAGVSPTIVFEHQQITLTLAGEKEDAEAKIYSYDQVLAALRLKWQLGRAIILSLGEKYSGSSYKQEESLFGLTRDDELWETDIGLTGHLWSSRDRRRSLTGQLGYARINANSNIPLYTYTKNIVTTSLSLGF